MLKVVSEKTGISFTYISASSENRQKELSRNNQVELLTVLSDKQDECKVDELLPVLEFYSKGENTTYCIGFTEIASPELIGKIRNAFLEISEEEKMGFLLANSNNNPDVSNKNRLIKIIILSISFLIVICGFLAVIAVKRKNTAIKIR